MSIHNFNQDLVDDLARGRVALFLGAGVSASAVTTTGNRISGWTDFLEKVCTKAPKSIQKTAKKLIKSNDLLLACELLKSSMSEEWESILMAEFSQNADPSPLHKSILDLNQRIIITTNFDKLLERAYETFKNDTRFSLITLQSVEEDAFRALKDHDRNYIIKLHGSIDRSESIIFTKSEYIGKAIWNFHYNSFLESILLNFTVLFIGFSMNDPAVSSILEMYATKYPKSRPHYLFTPEKSDKSVDSIMKKLRKTSMIYYDGSGGHEKLPAVIQELARKMTERRKEILAEMIAR
ncbi:SIR2 family protein [Niveispirillum sp. KHB5.9]|uniref:SIR2 family protein n=1 Tax=Niveispirillum sp. KHB5.9 TaxID=3400269 RepID=UPI003A8998F2